MALAITRMEQQQLAMLAVINRTATAADATATATAPMTVTKQTSIKHIIDTMLTSENREVAATLHSTHCDSTSDSNNNVSDSGTVSTDTGTSHDNSNSAGIDNNSGVGPMLDMTAYSRFESTLSKVQVHASDIVRVDANAIGTGGFAKVYKVLLKGDQLCAAKVSVTIHTCHALLLLYCIYATS
jgi:hypothetical protein